MLSAQFYDDKKFDSVFHARVGAPLRHTSPPPLSCQGTVRLVSAATTLFWSVDPGETVLQLLFLHQPGVVPNNDDENASSVFLSRKWNVSFSSEVVACGVTTVKAELNENQEENMIRVVWLSASLTIEVLTFRVQYARDGPSLVVEPCGAGKTSGVLSGAAAAFGGADFGHVQAAIVAEAPSPYLTSVLLTDGQSLWLATVDSEGQLNESCLLAPKKQDTSSQSSSHVWSLFRGWRSAAQDGDDAPPSDTRRGGRMIAGVAAVPGSEGFLVTHARGSVAHMENFRQASTQEAVGSFEAANAPTSSITTTLFSGSARGSSMLAVSVGRLAATQAECVWVHSVDLVKRAFDEVACVVAPADGCFVQSVCAGANSAHVLWVAPCDGGGAVSVSTASLCSIATASAAAGGPNRLMHLQSLKLTTAVGSTMSLCDVRLLSSLGSAPHHIAFHNETEASLLAFWYHQQQTVGHVLVEAAPSWLSTPLVHITEWPMPPASASTVPFSHMAFASSFVVDEDDECALLQSSRAVTVGLRVIASHEDGCQTFVNLLSDIVNNISTATTLGGFHELAAAAHIFSLRHAAASVSADDVLTVIASSLAADSEATSVMSKAVRALELSTATAPGVRSRILVQHVVGVDLLQRAAHVAAAYVGWISLNGHSHPQHQIVQSAAQAALETLCAGVNVAAAAGADVPAIAARSTGNVVSDVLHHLLNWDRDHAALHAVEVAWSLFNIGGARGFQACNAWCTALHHRHPLLHHMRILQLLESCRTTSGVEVSALSRFVASAVAALPSEDAVCRFLAIALTSLSCADWDTETMLRAHPELAGDIYRAGLLRRLLPRGSVQHALISANHALSAFLPQVVSLRLTAVEDLGPGASLVQTLSGLVGDTYVLLSRASIDDEDVAAACRWMSMALHESFETTVESVQRCAVLLAELVLSTSSVHIVTSTINVSLIDPEVLRIVTAAFMHGLHKSVHLLRTSRKPEQEKQLVSATISVFRFLVRRHAFGQAARLCLDIATALRQPSDRSPTTLIAVEQLLALALSSVEAIHDDMPLVAVPEAPKGVSPMTREDSVFPNMSPASGAGAAWRQKATVSGGQFLCKESTALVRRKLVEAIVERQLVMSDHVVDLREGCWGEDLSSAAAQHYGNRLMRSLVSARLFGCARQLCDVINDTSMTTFALQCEGLALLEDPRHRAYTAVAEKDPGVASSSVFAVLLSQWRNYVNECVSRSSASNNFEPLQSACCALLARDPLHVPRLLLDALRVSRPSALVGFILSCSAVEPGCDTGVVPCRLAALAFETVADELSRGEPAPSTATAGIVDRTALLAKAVLERFASASESESHLATAAQGAEKLLDAVSRLGAKTLRL